MNAQSMQARTRFSLLLVFILSGFAGLIYQSIWSHYLGLLLGHAAYAQALVLTIFMGGMALGAAWIARVGEGWRNLIRIYAIIELLIGLAGLVFHSIFDATLIFSWSTLFPALHSVPALAEFARWGLAALLILPQTILLGMTFPLMSGGLIRRFPGQDGRTLGALYFTNSIGAALGALSAAFLLLPVVGLPGALTAAAILNLVVAALAFVLARRPEPQTAKAAQATTVPQQLSKNPLLRLVLLATATSGAASFVYEVVWIRMIGMAVGSTLHAFELMLAAFIAGLAFGGLWVRKHADNSPDPVRLVGWMQICMGLAALLSLLAYANAFEWVGWIMAALDRSDAGYNLYLFGTALISLLIMLPAAFFAGTTLPLFTVTLLRAGLGERAIGRVYAWNTIGSIVGVIAAIHFLIPFLGLKLAIILAALIDMAVGLFLLRWRMADTRADIGRFSVTTALVAVALALAVVKIPFDPYYLTSGVYRHGISKVPESEKILYYRDGKTASISSKLSRNGMINIATNGKPDAGVQMDDNARPSLDEATMALLGALPLTLHPAPKTAALIGFGSGISTHTLLADPGLERVETIEIEQAIVDGAHVFGKRSERAYQDPRSHIIIDDAKAWFSGRPMHYDIIVSEPSNPWISGVGALFSKEFYRLVPHYLSEDGIFVQWVQLYEINDELVASIFKALEPAFEDYAAWQTNLTDLIIIAKPRGKLPPHRWEKLFDNPLLRAELARQEILQPAHIKGRKIADARLLRAYSRLHGNSYPVNSDYLPILSLHAPRSRFLNASANNLIGLLEQSYLLEALAVRPPYPATLQPVRYSIYPPDSSMLRRAAALVEGLQNGYYTPPENESEADHDTLPDITLALQARAWLADCEALSDPRLRAPIAKTLRDLADITVTSLAAERLSGLWQAPAPAWAGCQNPPAPWPQIFTLLNAHAMRDRATVAQIAKDWFAQDGGEAAADDPLRKEFDAFVLYHWLLTLASEGKWDELTATMRQHPDAMPNSSEYAPPTSLLLSLADDDTPQEAEAP